MENQQIQRSNAIQIAVSVSLTFFWILNIFKAAYPTVSNSLNFYKPIGPLLGVYLASLMVLVLTFLVARSVKVESQKLLFWVLTASSVLFFLMVFPPIFTPLVAILPK